MPVTAVRDEGALRMWVCRLPVHIDHAERAVFYETLRRIRDFPMGRQSRRPLQRPSLSPVGAHDSVRPQDIPVLRESSANSQLPTGPMWASAPTTKCAGAIEFAKEFRKTAAFCRAEQSPAPTKASANSYCHTGFERRAFLPQLFKRNCSRIWLYYNRRRAP